MRFSRPLSTGTGIAAAVVCLDQLTKWWIVETVMKPPRAIEITPFFNLVMGWNRGISFGFFNNDSPLNSWVLPLVTVLIVCFLAVWLARARFVVVGTALGLIIGGALGNLIDRIRYGAVADFLDFHAFEYHWPAFNVADAAITVGAAVLVWDSLFAGEKPSKKRVKDRR
jgi:signal peptidase II